MKKVLCILVSLLFITGCSNSVSKKDEEIYKTSSYVSTLTDVSPTNIVSVELEHAYTPEFMKENADAIILRTIVNLDGASMEYNSVIGYTYGELLVQDTLLGNLESGSLISYAKPGCIIEAKEYELAQPKESQDKKTYLRKKAGVPLEATGYYDMLIENDIHIEAGKSYLIYLSYSESMQKYEIIGLGNGLRELNVDKTDTVSRTALQIDQLTILNNDTGVNEELQEYVDTYIK